MLYRKLLAACFLAILPSCFHQSASTNKNGSARPEEAISGSKSAERSRTQKGRGDPAKPGGPAQPGANGSEMSGSSEEQTAVKPIELPPDTCIQPKITEPAPWYFDDLKVVVTRLLMPCVTREGKAGFRNDTAFMAMAFPCSGGGGHLDFQGYYYLPKIASYIISTECPMQHPPQEALQQELRQRIGLAPQAQLVAINPFAVQFWEIASFGDSDVGFAVELTSSQALNGIWPKWKEGKPFDVRLYGRENTWAQGGAVYELLGRIAPSGKGFRLEIGKVRALDSESSAKVLGRCQSLRPRRECESVF